MTKRTRLIGRAVALATIVAIAAPALAPKTRQAAPHFNRTRPRGG